MIQRIQERLALLKDERQRRFTELAQFDAVIAELEQLLAPPAAAPDDAPPQRGDKAADRAAGYSPPAASARS